MEAAIFSSIGQSEVHLLLPDGGKWVRPWLKETIGARCFMEHYRDATGRTFWKVKRTHLETLSQALQGLYDGLWVIREYSTTQVCTGSCKSAKEDFCECSCGGQYHGDPDGNGWYNVAGDALIKKDRQVITRYYAKQVAA